jgi:hypothetical protein
MAKIPALCEVTRAATKPSPSASALLTEHANNLEDGKLSISIWACRPCQPSDGFTPTRQSGDHTLTRLCEKGGSRGEQRGGSISSCSSSCSGLSSLIWVKVYSHDWRVRVQTWTASRCTHHKAAKFKQPSAETSKSTLASVSV